VGSLEAFLGSIGSLTSPESAPHHASPSCTTDLPMVRATRLPRLLPPAGFSYLPASPHRSTTTARVPTLTRTAFRRRSTRARVVSTRRPRRGRPHAGTGISTRCPSTTPFGLALGPDLPRADKLDPGTLGHPAAGILTLHSLLMPAFSLAPPPRLGHPAASLVTRRSPTHRHTCTRTPAGARAKLSCRCRSFGGVLSPATLSAQNHLTSELLRTLSRMAASKPTSWLSTRLHILFHSAHT
jgi:hypothetical protein